MCVCVHVCMGACVHICNCAWVHVCRCACVHQVVMCPLVHESLFVYLSMFAMCLSYACLCDGVYIQYIVQPRPTLVVLPSPCSIHFRPHPSHVVLVLRMRNIILPMSNPLSYHVQTCPTHIHLVQPHPTHVQHSCPTMSNLVLVMSNLSNPCPTLCPTMSSLVRPRSSPLPYLVLPMSNLSFYQVQPCPPHAQPAALPLLNLAYNVQPCPTRVRPIVLFR
jgi:hypothetical protein